MWYSFARAFLFQLDAETSHNLTLRLLKILMPQWLIKKRLKKIPQHPVKVLGLTFPNFLGLAAGLDKSGDYFEALQSLGFGFIEVGTVTPKPQSGNPKPRLFRLPQSKALINRMGFNNLGIDYLVEKLKKYREKCALAPEIRYPLIGVNIGKNKDTPLENAANDYCECLKKAYPYADYITVNISSPNTPGLRELQASVYLTQLLTALDQAQKELIEEGHRERPLLIKIDPDMSDAALIGLVKIILEHRVAGIIATNTTIHHEGEQGGLSGAPLFHRSTQIIQRLHHLLAGRLPIIASGGIFSREDAKEKMDAGACLVQIYTGLIYQGPPLIQNIFS